MLINVSHMKLKKKGDKKCTKVIFYQFIFGYQKLTSCRLEG